MPLMILLFYKHVIYLVTNTFSSESFYDTINEKIWYNSMKMN